MSPPDVRAMVFERVTWPPKMFPEQVNLRALSCAQFCPSADNQT